MPTEKELILHQRAIERLRHQLFRKYGPADYRMIKTSLAVITLSVDTRGSERRMMLGGLQFLVGHGEAPLARVSLKHWEARVFGIHLYMLGAGQPYTRLSYSTDFAHVDDEALRCSHIGLTGI